MSRGDITGLILSYVYAFGMLALVEALGKRFRWPLMVTRKLIHIGAGMWIWGILYFFDHWYFGVIPFATFIVLNYVFYRRRAFSQMDGEDATPGTVYFALSITILFLLFWRTGGAPDRAPLAAAAVMAMTWGDAAGELVGRAVGRRQYAVFGHPRTLEGSAAVALFAFAAMFPTLWLLSGSALSPHSAPLSAGSAAGLAALGAAAAALLEAVSPAGTDNLTVPLGTALVLWAAYGSLIPLG